MEKLKLKIGVSIGNFKVDPQKTAAKVKVKFEIKVLEFVFQFPEILVWETFFVLEINT